ncbi:hypothetical protein HY792_02345 [Candidatus Desantisbacteria bacterium]|nr:hypothetical protein [Candidatus Desantisbacteria bacterium]
MAKVKGGFIPGFIVGMLLIGMIMGLYISVHPPKKRTIKSVTHLKINKVSLKEDIHEVFYPEGNAEQQKIASETVKKMSLECKKIQALFNISSQEMLTGQMYGFVFCPVWRNDPFIETIKDDKWLIVDNVTCWPIVCEWGWPFQNPDNRYYLHCLFPYYTAQEVLKKSIPHDETAQWFIDGLCGYASAICWQQFDRKAYMNYEYDRGVVFFDHNGYATATINLLDPGHIKEGAKEFVFLPAETFFIIDLVKKHKTKVIPLIISKLSASKTKPITGEEVLLVIKEITGEDMSTRAKSISRDEVLGRFGELGKKMGR